MGIRSKTCGNVLTAAVRQGGAVRTEWGGSEAPPPDGVRRARGLGSAVDALVLRVATCLQKIAAPPRDAATRVVSLTLCFALSLLPPPAFGQGLSRDARDFEARVAQSQRLASFADVVATWPVEIYDPGNRVRSEAMLAQFRRVVAKYRDKPPADEAQLSEFLEALAPLLRYLQAYDLYFQPGALVVPPGGLAGADVQSYCLDSGRGAPPNNEPLKLIPASTVFPAKVLPIYQSLMRQDAASGDHRLQGLVWHLRGLVEGRTEFSSFSKSDLMALELAHPGSGRILQRLYAGPGVRIDGRRITGMYDIKKVIANRVLGTEELSTEATIARLIGMPVEGRADPNNGYTALAPGVTARAFVTNGMNGFRVDVTNSSRYPYVFDSTQWIGNPSRKVQRLALANIERGVAPTAAERAAADKVLRFIQHEYDKIDWARTGTPKCGVEAFGEMKGWGHLSVEVLKALPLAGNLIAGYELITQHDILKDEPLSVADNVLDLIAVYPGGNNLSAAFRALRVRSTVMEIVSAQAIGPASNCTEVFIGSYAPWLLPNWEWLRERVAKEVNNGEKKRTCETNLTAHQLSGMFRKIVSPFVETTTSSRLTTADVCP